MVLNEALATKHGAILAATLRGGTVLGHCGVSKGFNTDVLRALASLHCPKTAFRRSDELIVNTPQAKSAAAQNLRGSYLMREVAKHKALPRSPVVSTQMVPFLPRSAAPPAAAQT